MYCVVIGRLDLAGEGRMSELGESVTTEAKVVVEEKGG